MYNTAKEYEKNKKNTKCCARCSIERSVSDFTKDGHRKDGLCNHCKFCKQYFKRQNYLRRRGSSEVLSTKIKYCRVCGKVFPYAGNKVQCIGCAPIYKKIYKRLGISSLKEYKNKLQEDGCGVCGYKRCMAALEFHHVSGKDKNIGELKSIGEILKEITNHHVVVLCANCHREVHHNSLDISHLKRLKG